MLLRPATGSGQDRRTRYTLFRINTRTGGVGFRILCWRSRRQQPHEHVHNLGIEVMSGLLEQISPRLLG